MRRSALVFLIAACAALRLCHVGVVWVEEAYPLAAARAMLHGSVLYRDIWFDKPPLFPAVYTLFGAHAGWPLRLAGVLFLLFAAWAAARAVRQIYRASRVDARWAAALTAFFLTFDFPATAMALTPDLLALPFQFLAVGAAASTQPLLAGLFCGIALGFNSKALLFAVVCLLWLVWNAAHLRGRTSRARLWRYTLWKTSFLAGFALPVGAIALWLAAHGALADHWREVWVWGAAYSGDTMLAHPLVEGLRRTLSWAGFHIALVVAAWLALRRPGGSGASDAGPLPGGRGAVATTPLPDSRGSRATTPLQGGRGSKTPGQPEHAESMGGPELVGLAPLAGVLSQVGRPPRPAPGPLARLFQRVRRSSGAGPTRRSAADQEVCPTDAPLFLLWMAISLAGVWLGWRFFPRYFFQLLPALLVPAARGFALATPRWRAVLLACLALPLVRFAPASLQLGWETLHGALHASRDLALFTDAQHAARVVRALAQPGDTALVWGYRPELYVLTGLLPGTRFLDSQPLNGVLADRHLTSSTPTMPDWARTNREALYAAQREPEWILDGLGPINPRLTVFDETTGLAQWRGDYTLVGSTATIAIYQRTRWRFGPSRL
jgi:hypothetical protein